MSHPIDPASDRLLRGALRVNAAFSGACGVLALVAAGALAAILGIREHAILPVQGASLVFFSGVLVWLVTRKAIKPALALAIVVMDVLWVLSTPLPLLLSGWLTPAGTGTMIVLSAIVLTFAAVQYAGLRQMKAGARAPA
jgi:hypothetical protein